MIFDRKTILTMKQQKQGGESAFNTNLAGEHIFLVGHLLPWRGSVSAGSLRNLTVKIIQGVTLHPQSLFVV